MKDIPLWPLYFLLRSGTMKDISLALQKISPEQRTFIYDLDLWEKQDFDVDRFSKWLQILYLANNEEVITDFVKHINFRLYLKARFNIYTHDVEHPVYPDHDNFFITDDFSFLLEYDADFSLVEEIKHFLGVFYDTHGVEITQSILMEIVNDSFYQIQEQEYNKKKSRLEDSGHVDFYEALKDKNLIELHRIDKFILSKIKNKYILLEDESLASHGNELLLNSDSNSINDQIKKEISNVEDELILNFLPMDYIRTINSGMTRNESFKKNDDELAKDSRKIQSFITLGFDFIIAKYQEALAGRSIFEFFTFKDLELLGRSLILGNSKKIKSVLKNFNFNYDDDFLGDFFKLFLQDLFDLDYQFKFESKLE